MKTSTLLTTLSIGALTLSSALAETDQFATAAEMGLMQGFPPAADKIVDRSSLLKGPGNRWSYLNMRKLYPSAGVKNAKTAVPVEVKIDPAIQSLKVNKPNDKGANTDQSVDMDTFLRETYSDTLVVVKGGKVVYEKYLNGMNANQPHQMMSVTKSFAGLFGLMAVADGKVSESDLVAKYLPELKSSTAFGDATFGQVLNMTNSIDFTEDYADPESGIVHYAGVLGLMPQVPGKKYASSIYQYLPTLMLDKKHPKHGELFHYQTPKTDVVNWLTNRATNKSFEDNMHEVLWSKLGTDGETYVLLDKNGTLFAGGGLNATPYDLARFGAMMTSGGKFSGQQVVTAETIKALSDGGNQKAFASGPNSSGKMAEEPWSYRAQWWVRHAKGKEAFTAIGVHGQWIYCDVHRGVAIIKQSSQPVSASDYFDAYNLNAFDAIIEYLTK
ncbi:serine hydrolase domain-containing protein [Rubritalea marina]|uniref:serine hydrolase domain-containing protein n=1 Tax=Rubritalea marina TaxID=361055 RepID=UPI0003707E5C|nr:serine hydrolase [Rubritalea marina]